MPMFFLARSCSLLYCFLTPLHAARGKNEDNLVVSQHRMHFVCPQRHVRTFMELLPAHCPLNQSVFYDVYEETHPKFDLGGRRHDCSVVAADPGSWPSKSIDFESRGRAVMAPVCFRPFHDWLCIFLSEVSSLGYHLGVWSLDYSEKDRTACLDQNLQLFQ